MVKRAPRQVQDPSAPRLHRSIRIDKQSTNKHMMVPNDVPFHRGFLTFLNSRADWATTVCIVSAGRALEDSPISA